VYGAIEQMQVKQVGNAALSVPVRQAIGKAVAKYVASRAWELGKELNEEGMQAATLCGAVSKALKDQGFEISEREIVEAMWGAYGKDAVEAVGGMTALALVGMGGGGARMGYRQATGKDAAYNAEAKRNRETIDQAKRDFKDMDAGTYEPSPKAKARQNAADAVENQLEQNVPVDNSGSEQGAGAEETAETQERGAAVFADRAAADKAVQEYNDSTDENKEGAARADMTPKASSSTTPEARLALSPNNKITNSAPEVNSESENNFAEPAAEGRGAGATDNFDVGLSAESAKEAEARQSLEKEFGAPMPVGSVRVSDKELPATLAAAGEVFDKDIVVLDVDHAKVEAANPNRSSFDGFYVPPAANADGTTSRGKIYVASDSERPLYQVVAHELWHGSEGNKELKDAIWNAMKLTEAGKTALAEEGGSEFMADYVFGQALNDKVFWRELSGKVGAIVRFARDAMRALKPWYIRAKRLLDNNRYATAEEFEAIEGIGEHVMNMRELFDQLGRAVREAKQQGGGTVQAEAIAERFLALSGGTGGRRKPAKGTSYAEKVAGLIGGVDGKPAAQFANRRKTGEVDAVMSAYQNAKTDGEKSAAVARLEALARKDDDDFVNKKRKAGSEDAAGDADATLEDSRKTYEKRVGGLKDARAKATEPEVPQQTIDRWRGKGWSEERIAEEVEDRKEEIRDARTNTVPWLYGYEIFSDAEAATAVKRLRESKTPFAVEATDFGNFSGLNKAKGHTKADEAAKAIIADIYTKEASAYGGIVIRRKGADEFAVIWPGFTKEEVTPIRKAIEMKMRQARDKAGLGEVPYTKGVTYERDGVKYKLSDGLEAGSLHSFYDIVDDDGKSQYFELYEMADDVSNEKKDDFFHENWGDDATEIKKDEKKYANGNENDYVNNERKEEGKPVTTEVENAGRKSNDGVDGRDKSGRGEGDTSPEGARARSVAGMVGRSHEIRSGTDSGLHKNVRQSELHAPATSGNDVTDVAGDAASLSPEARDVLNSLPPEQQKVLRDSGLKFARRGEAKNGPSAPENQFPQSEGIDISAKNEAAESPNDKKTSPEARARNLICAAGVKFAERKGERVDGILGRLPLTTSFLELPDLKAMRGKRVKAATIEQALNRKGVKEIEKELVRGALEQFKGQPSFDYGEFEAAVRMNIAPLQRIEVSNYAQYGLDAMPEIGASVTASKTVIMNFPGVEHGKDGHFSSAYNNGEGGKVKYIARQLNDNTWVAVDEKYSEGATAENIERYVATAGSERAVKDWIDKYGRGEEGEREGGDTNKGLYGHFRVWTAKDGRVYVAEAQSDYFQKHSAKKDLEKRSAGQRADTFAIENAGVNLTPEERQFAASQKTWERRLLHEAVRYAVERGADEVLFPSPYAVALIEGYVEDGGQAAAPNYTIEGEDRYRDIKVGDIVRDAGGDRHIVHGVFDDVGYEFMTWPLADATEMPLDNLKGLKGVKFISGEFYQAVGGFAHIYVNGDTVYGWRSEPAEVWFEHEIGEITADNFNPSSLPEGQQRVLEKYDAYHKMLKTDFTGVETVDAGGAEWYSIPVSKNAARPVVAFASRRKAARGGESLPSMEEARQAIPEGRRKYFEGIWDSGQMVTRATMNDPKNNRPVFIPPPTRRMKDELARLFGKDVKAERQSITFERAHHISERHGVGNEKQADQKPVTRETFVLIPDILANFDSVEKRPNNSVQISKEYSDGRMVVADAVLSDGNLEIKTMWIKSPAGTNSQRTKANGMTTLNRSHPSDVKNTPRLNARSEGAVLSDYDNKITDSAPEVNSKTKKGEKSSGAGVRFATRRGEAPEFGSAVTAGVPDGDLEKYPNARNRAKQLWDKMGTASPFFKKWFGDSKVVDEDGKPLVVYHGTNEKFNVFDKGKIGSNTGRLDVGVGFYFSDLKSGAMDSGADWYGTNVDSYYLSMKNPFVVPKDDKKLGEMLVELDDDISTRHGEKLSDRLAEGYQILLRDISPSRLTKLLTDKGFDGIISGRQYVAFQPEQIKSATDNAGTFDSGNPDIRFARRGRGGDYISGESSRDEGQGEMIRRYTPNEEVMAKGRKNLVWAKSVAELTGNEFAKGETSLFDQVSDYFGSVGNSVYNEELGDVGLSRNGIRDDIAHGVGRLKAITFAAVPNVLEHGTIISYTENHKGRGYDTAIIAAPVNIGGNRHYVAAVVNRNRGKSGETSTQQFYLHEVYSNKKTSELFKTVAHLLQGAERSSSDASNNKIGGTLAEAREDSRVQPHPELDVDGGRMLTEMGIPPHGLSSGPHIYTNKITDSAPEVNSKVEKDEKSSGVRFADRPSAAERARRDADPRWQITNALREILRGQGIINFSAALSDWGRIPKNSREDTDKRKAWEKKWAQAEDKFTRFARDNPNLFAEAGFGEANDTERGLEDRFDPHEVIYKIPEWQNDFDNGKMDKTVKEYQESTDGKLVNLAQKIKDGKLEKPSGINYNAGAVSGRAVADIRNLTNIDVSGFEHNISGGAIRHIEKRHGENGEADQSMADLNDVGRIKYVLDNYDEVNISIDKDGNVEQNTQYNDSNNKPSPVIVYKKRVNGSIYVVEAVPDTKAKKLQLVTAYKNKGRHVSDGDIVTPATHVRNVRTHYHTNKITDSAPEVNSKIEKDEKSSGVRFASRRSDFERARRDGDPRWQIREALRYILRSKGILGFNRALKEWGYPLPGAKDKAASDARWKRAEAAFAQYARERPGIFAGAGFPEALEDGFDPLSVIHKMADWQNDFDKGNYMPGADDRGTYKSWDDPEGISETLEARKRKREAWQERSEAAGALIKELTAQAFRLHAIHGSRTSTMDAKANKNIANILGSLVDFRDKLGKTMVFFQDLAYDYIRENSDSTQGLFDDLRAWREERGAMPQAVRDEVEARIGEAIADLETGQMRELLDVMNKIKEEGRLRRGEQLFAEQLERQINIDNMLRNLNIDLRELLRPHSNRMKDKADAAEKFGAPTVNKVKKLLWENMRAERIFAWFDGTMGKKGVYGKRGAGMDGVSRMDDVARQKADLKDGEYLIDDPGLLTNAVFNPIIEGEDDRQDGLKTAVERYQEIHKDIDPAAARKDVLTTVDMKKTDRFGVVVLLVEDGKFNLENDEDLGTEPKEITYSNAMFVYAHSQNEEGMAHLVGSGYTADGIEQIIKELPKKYKAAVDAMIDYFDTEQFGRVNEVFIREHNTEMIPVDRYFAIRNLDLKPNASAADVIGGENAARAAVKKGMTKGRIESYRPFNKEDYFTVVVESIMEAEKYIAYNDAIRNANKYLLDERLAAGMKEKNELAYKELLQWVEDAARAKPTAQEVIETFFSKAARNVAITSLGGNMLTCLKQTQSGIQALAYINPVYVTKSVLTLVRHLPSTMAAIKEKSVMMRNREDSIEQIFSDMAERGQVNKIIKMRLSRKLGVRENLDQIVDRYNEFMMSGIKGIDMLTASIVWQAKYSAVLDKTGDETAAVRAADALIRKTQSMGGDLNVPRSFRSRSAVTRTFTMFMNDSNQNLNLLFEVIEGWKNRSAAANAGLLFAHGLAPALVMGLIANGFKRFPWSEPEEYLDWLIDTWFGGAPLVGDVAKGLGKWGTNAIREARGRDKDYISGGLGTSPAQAIFEEAERVLNGQTSTDQLIKLAGILGGVSGYVPYKRIKGTIESGDWQRAVWSESALKDRSVFAAMEKRANSTNDEVWEKYDDWYNALTPERQNAFDAYCEKVEAARDAEVERQNR